MKLTQKVKVLLVVGSMDVGGIENYIMTILRNLDVSAITVDLLYITNKKCFYDDEIKKIGFEIIRITGRDENIIKHNKQFKDILKLGAYDVVHIHYGTATCFMDAKIAKKAGVKKVIVQSHNSAGCNRLINNIFKMIYSRYADVKLSCSKEAAEWLYMKKDLKDVRIINNAINTDKFVFNNDKRLKYRKLLNIDYNTFVIGEVARLNDQKNHDYLLDVLSNYDFMDYKLLVVGDGELRQPFLEKAEKLNISDKVIITGNVSNPQDYLSVFDTFVMPSKYEGLPVSLIEAQCNGLPCIISNHIDKNVDLTGNIDFLDIGENDIKDWCKYLNKVKNRKRENMAQLLVKEKGYDINESIKQIYDMYVEN